MGREMLVVGGCEVSLLCAPVTSRKTHYIVTDGGEGNVCQTEFGLLDRNDLVKVLSENYCIENILWRLHMETQQRQVSMSSCRVLLLRKIYNATSLLWSKNHNHISYCWEKCKENVYALLQQLFAFLRKNSHTIVTTGMYKRSVVYSRMWLTSI